MIPGPITGPITGPIAGPITGVLLFALLAYPSLWAELYLRRELLRLGELTGLLTPGNLGGQILGYNYLRNPEWYHWFAGGISGALGYAPAFILSLLLMRRITGAHRVSHCGACGAALRALTLPVCPACKEKF
jgi:hypothetical protein